MNINTARYALVAVAISSVALFATAFLLDVHPYVLALCAYACGHSVGLWRASRLVQP